MTSPRQPVQVVEVEADSCGNTYGVNDGVTSFCTATGAPGSECFNTIGTCQDTDNYQATTKVIRFCKPTARLPQPLLASGEGYEEKYAFIPALDKVDVTPTRLNPGGQSGSSGPLGERGKVRVVLKDLPSSDLLLDPYVANRAYDPLAQGTFATKFLARNLYLQDRPLRVRYGYLGEDLDAMQVYHFVIDSVSPPNSSGQWQIDAVDVLRWADDDKAKLPALSSGKLESALSNSATSFSVVEAQLSDYDSPAGTVRIGDECITYTGVSEVGSVLTFTGCTRATDGTEADAYDAGETVQRCLRYTDEAPVDLIEEFLLAAGLDASILDTANWADESDTWLIGYELSALITEPTGIAQLIGEVCEQVGIFIWWDERAQLVKLQALRPPLDAVPTISDESNIVKGSLAFKNDPTQRISQLWFYYGVKNPTKDLDKPTNYKFGLVSIADNVGENKNRTDKVREIFSRWVQNDTQALDLSARCLQRFKNTVMRGTVALDAKDRDDIWTGSVVDLRSRLLTDATGAKTLVRFQVITAKEVDPGHRVEYELLAYTIAGAAEKGGVYMADDADPYSDPNATGCWYAGADGKMSDGAAGWRYQ